MLAGAGVFLSLRCGFVQLTHFPEVMRRTVGAATSIFEDMTQEITMGTSLSMLVSLIGVALPLAVLIDLLLDKQRKANPKDKKTDWFYKNEKFDRELDERADKNNYRTL